MEDRKKLIQAQKKLESILGTKKKADVKIGQSVRIADFPRKEKVKGIVTDPFGYEFFFTDYRVKHSLKDKKPHHEKAIADLWKRIGEFFSNPDVIIHDGLRGALLYAFRRGELFVVFVAGVEKRVLWTAYTRKLLRETERFKFLYEKEGI